MTRLLGLPRRTAAAAIAGQPIRPTPLTDHLRPCPNLPAHPQADYEGRLTWWAGGLAAWPCTN